MASDIQELLLKIKPQSDKIRADVDLVRKVLAQFDITILGKIAESIPTVGTILKDAVAALDVIDSGVDAIDGVIDSYAAPAIVPDAPQAIVP